MRDENDGRAAAFELAHDVQQFVGLLGRQHRRRLIQDEHLGVAHQRLDDFNALLDSHREVLHEGVGIDVEPVAVRDLLDLAAGVVQVQEAAGLGGLGAERHVFRHGEHGHQHEVLVHHADAGSHGVTGSPEADRFVIDEDFAVGGLIQPVKNIHQGGLAGPVFAQQTMDLSGFNNHVYVIIGEQGAEAFGDPLEFKFQNSDQSRCVRNCWPDGICGCRTSLVPAVMREPEGAQRKAPPPVPVNDHPGGGA